MSESNNLTVQHGAALVQNKMYIFGGNHNGRYLNDLQVCKECCLLLSELKCS